MIREFRRTHRKRKLIVVKQSYVRRRMNRTRTHGIAPAEIGYGVA